MSPELDYAEIARQAREWTFAVAVHVLEQSMIDHSPCGCRSGSRREASTSHLGASGEFDVRISVDEVSLYLLIHPRSCSGHRGSRW
jgi:hypothetical protein